MPVTGGPAATARACTRGDLVAAHRQPDDDLRVPGGGRYSSGRRRHRRGRVVVDRSGGSGPGLTLLMALVHMCGPTAPRCVPPRSGDGRDPVRRGRLRDRRHLRPGAAGHGVRRGHHADPRRRADGVASATRLDHCRKDSLVWHQQLDVDTDAWADADRHKSFLYTGARLELSLLQRDEVNKNYRNLLSADNDRFLDDAIAARAHTRRLRSIGIGVGGTAGRGVDDHGGNLVSAGRSSGEGTQCRRTHGDDVQHTEPAIGQSPQWRHGCCCPATKRYPGDGAIVERILGAVSSPLATSVSGTPRRSRSGLPRSGKLVASAGGDRTVRVGDGPRLWGSPEICCDAGVVFGNSSPR